MLNVKAALAERNARVKRLTCGVLFRLQSFWLGVHYSTYDRRICINLLPCVTLWVALPGGYVPR